MKSTKLYLDPTGKIDNSPVIEEALRIAYKGHVIEIPERENRFNRPIEMIYRHTLHVAGLDKTVIKFRKKK